MNKIILVLLVTPLLHCKPSHKQQQEAKAIQTNQATEIAKKLMPGKVFFDYDQIDYYRSNITDNEAQSLLEPSSNPLDDLKNAVILGTAPISIADTAFVSTLKQISYSKTNISSTIFKQIDSIFIEKKPLENIGTNCIYVYRNILVFRKKSKITGIAKICFRCMAHIIVGTDARTMYFGQDGDYDKLEKLLLN